VHKCHSGPAEEGIICMCGDGGRVVICLNTHPENQGRGAYQLLTPCTHGVPHVDCEGPGAVTRTNAGWELVPQDRQWDIQPGVLRYQIQPWHLLYDGACSCCRTLRLWWWSSCVACPLHVAGVVRQTIPGVVLLHWAVKQWDLCCLCSLSCSSCTPVTWCLR
jgi:hypothetical protein